MITLDELDKIFATHCLSADREERRAGLAAVVRALEPSLEQWFFNISSIDRTVTSPETAIWANEFIKSILGGDRGSR